ncbi:MAG: CRISPR-associated RAMP protein Csx7 [Candidatus Aenigmatarchaeota archaeon]
MYNWFSHETVNRLLKITFEIKTESPIRIGAGKNVTKLSLVDLPVVIMRIGDRDLPYIPGSSLKGVFRASSEFLAKSYGLNVCLMGEGCKNNYDRELQDSIKTGDVEKIKVTLAKYCLICKIYGSATFRSHVNFEDASPPEDRIPSRNIKTGIAIDRKSGAVKSGALYQVEFLNPGEIFNQTTFFINIPNYGMGLFAEVLSNINSGFIKIGGFKSRGFGKVYIRPKKLDGFIVVNGGQKDIKDVKYLSPLDNDDEGVEIDGTGESDLISLMEKFRGVWRNYVNKARSRS